MQKFTIAILVLVLTACTAMPQNARQVTPTPTLPPTQQPTLTNTPILTLPSTPTRMYILQVGGSGSQATIQSAINAAKDGDTIQVAQGSYFENISIPNSLKNIRIEGGWNEDFSSRSEDNSLTIIDGGAKDRVINVGDIKSGIHSFTIEGFTIRNGMAEDDGGAIYSRVFNKDVKMTLSLINNTIEKNLSRHMGGGLYLETFDSATLDLIMEKNILNDNSTNNAGGGIAVLSNSGSSLTVSMTQNIILRNTVPHKVEGLQGGWDGGGIAAYASSDSAKTTLLLTNNIISENEAGFGGGVWMYALRKNTTFDASFINNIIVLNRGGYGAALMTGCGVTDPVDSIGEVSNLLLLNLTNNTIANNFGENTGGVHLSTGSSFGGGGETRFTSRNDIFWGNSGNEDDHQLILTVQEIGKTTANIDYSDMENTPILNEKVTIISDNIIIKDPIFVDPSHQNYQLEIDSPAIDAGDPDPQDNDGQVPPGMGSNRNDLGAYGGPNNAVWDSLIEKWQHLVDTSILETSLTPVVTSTFVPLPKSELKTVSRMAVENDGMMLMLVPEGEFEMGSNDGNDDEKPVRAVWLDSFWIDQTEVTNAMYGKCVTEGTCKPSEFADNNMFNGSDQPVVGVDWNDATAYCKWAGRRLPTEAEWEKAARGTDGRTYPWGEGLACDKANYEPCKNITTEVGTYAIGASPYGVLDMAGNVWEWTADWYDPSYYNNSTKRNPAGPGSGEYRVLRGGSWDPDGGVRAAYRGAGNPDFGTRDFGFRCAVSQ
ncbi:MAG: SUMF1/EgtB/PvdO family nonheme iron enzyme [Chloroflexi bacterium]|nr:SUMF1/EgtB/PvdO family nonheme iron enzyme [Chloroflexota bacterium]